MRRHVWIGSLLASLVLGPRVQAQSVTQVKPWFLLIVDTSSSMGACTTSPCGANDPTNVCGFRRNRIGDAKCAIQRIVASTGDAEFALLQYAHPCRADCSETSDGLCDAQLLVPVADSNQPQLYEWVDGTCQGNCNDNNYTREIRMGNRTPIAASLDRAHQYLAGTLPRSQVAGIASGGSPYPSPIASDPYLACRPVSVIMLTDGAESCGGDPNARAAALLNTNTAPLGKQVRTYAIGFGVTEGNTGIESLAMAGGTDAPGANFGFYAANEAQLSIALNTIIAESQLPPETCNGMDDNCNGLIDEGIQKFCDPMDIAAGPTLCDEPDEIACDGIDDDCDGIVDEGVTNACGVCGTPPIETCDNLDNDCDGRIDESVVTGEPCGTAEGTCQVGTTDCVNGNLICVGQLVPGVEICDCIDNDCDGFIDETFDDEGLCATGASCVACGCQTLCTVSEFSDISCPGNLMSEVLDTGLCVCVDSTCDANACGTQSLERNGEVVCAPDSDNVTRCVCKAGECVDACAGVTCPSEQVCDKRDSRGTCRPDNCFALGCLSAEVCNAVTGECEPDACADITCADEEACRNGVCEPTCAGVSCERGQRCSGGACVIDRCGSANCESDETCDPSDGSCTTSMECATACLGDATCNGLTGECVENPCRRLRCPAGTECSLRECVGDGAGTDAGQPPQNVLATGGGGCTCTVAGVSQSDGRGWFVLALIALLFGLRRGLFVRRAARPRSVSKALLAFVGMAFGVAGCSLDPFCVNNCVEPGEAVDAATHDTGDDGGSDSGSGGVGGGDDASVAGSGGSGGTGGSRSCRQGTTEICNGRDDDCDFKLDEEAFEPINFCDTRGVCADDQLRCAGAAGWICRHGDNYEATETLCDSLDNDCDGAIDEGTSGLGGDCGTGVGACRVSGEFVCHPSGVGTQCSVTQPASPGVEVCDGIDNDCDGLIDEPKSAPGDNPSYVQETLVQVGNVFVYPYEASRPDATTDAQGNLSGRACSRQSVLPWTNLTYDEARAACQAADMDLCTEAQWRTACEDGTGNNICAWSFTASNNSCGDLASNPDQCNGEEFDSDTSTAMIDDDALLPTGSLTRCFSNTAGGPIFDLSGNAKEFTRARSSGVNPLRGGSYNNVAAGLRCDFDFTVVNNAFKFQNVGFRCCATTNPN